MPKKYAFAPDYAVPPGDTLKEVLDLKGLSQADLACRGGMTEKMVSQIVNNGTPITHEIAAKLDLVTGVPARFWNNRESNYRESLVRIEEAGTLESATEWLKLVPVAVLRDRGYVASNARGAELVREVLKFFGVSGIEAWHSAWGEPCVQYRGGEATERHPGYVAAWLRIGELQAQAIETAPYDRDEFKRAMTKIRTLTLGEIGVWCKEVTKLCAAAGVAVVFTKEIEKAGVSGAARWLTKDKALIQLSLKYKSDDQLIFTFFHEAAHVLLHGKKQVFIEFGLHNNTEEELEANAFARDLLIPPNDARRLPHLKTRAQIRAFADSLGIAAGIVVGRLQHDELVFRGAFSDLKRKVIWK
jgi:HTH-type transcriptional regulator / antitoxin HigA